VGDGTRRGVMGGARRSGDEKAAMAMVSRRKEQWRAHVKVLELQTRCLGWSRTGVCAVSVAAKVGLLVSRLAVVRWTKLRCLQLGVYDTTFYHRRLLSISPTWIATASLHCGWRHLCSYRFTSLGIQKPLV
jgi:hypothetical protein